MDRKEIEAKVKNFMIEDLEIDEEKICPDALLKKDLGIDKIKSEEMAGVKTFSAFCDYLESKLG